VGDVERGHHEGKKLLGKIIAVLARLMAIAILSFVKE
jgi:hypothetical protein